MKAARVLGVMAVAAGLAAGSVMATEGGGGAYPNGAEDFMTGALPPPGNYLVNYVLNFSSDRFNNDDGDRLMPVFEFDMWADVVRYIHVSKTTIGGASWAQHIFVPIVTKDVKMSGPEGATLKDDVTGLGDIIVDPLILGWHFPNFHCAAGVDVYVPVGQYDEDDLVSVGRNYWTIEPVLAATWLNGPCEVSAKLMYDYNLKNPDTDIDSGDEVHADFVGGWKVSTWMFGVSGYCYQQVTDDDYPSAVPAENRLDKAQALAAGPVVGCQLGKVSVQAKYVEEFEVRNRPEGEVLWFKIICPL